MMAWATPTQLSRTQANLRHFSGEWPRVVNRSDRLARIRLNRFANRFSISLAAFRYRSQPHKPYKALPAVKEHVPTFRRPYQHWAAAEIEVKGGASSNLECVRRRANQTPVMAILRTQRNIYCD